MTKAKGGYTRKENGKLNTGRKSAMTPERINKLEQAFCFGCTDEEACLFADIGTSTLYTYCQANPSFSERKELLKKRMILEAKEVIRQSLNSVDPKVSTDTAKWYLERKAKSEFSTRIENTGADGSDLSPVVFNINPVRVENGGNQS